MSKGVTVRTEDALCTYSVLRVYPVYNDKQFKDGQTAIKVGMVVSPGVWKIVWMPVFTEWFDAGS